MRLVCVQFRSPRLVVSEFQVFFNRFSLPFYSELRLIETIESYQPGYSWYFSFFHGGIRRSQVNIRVLGFVFFLSGHVVNKSVVSTDFLRLSLLSVC